ncbi:MAG: hypothetical protein NTW95_06155 [Candidatus Aminicenantes bacterium]|nr:hypothetical protein [Candidatus Aminicenantes bacterium]
MDAFESVIASILQRQGYWTQTSVKVDLTKADKLEIGRHSSPRWELDVVAYQGRGNELRIVECKSFLDSPGVQCTAFDGSNPIAAKRYKLFCDATLRRVVFRRLEQQMVDSGFCCPKPTINLCLAAGKIKGDGDWLRGYFEKRGWLLIGPDEIKRELEALRESGYENSVAAVVTKLLLRGPRNTGQRTLPESGLNNKD